MTQKNEAFENIVGKGENPDSQHFHLFLQCFLSFEVQISIFESHSLILSIANAFSLDLWFGKELTLSHMTIPDFSKFETDIYK